MGGGGNTTTVQRADPWSGVQPQLLGGVRRAEQLFNRGGFQVNPFQGDRVAGLSPTSMQGMDMIQQQALQPGATPTAQGALSRMMSGEDIYRDLDRVKQEALESAVPAAAAMFSNSGMINSGQAQTEVGRAAAQAVAPIEYGAWNEAQGRRLQAAGLSPTVDAASYLPGQMMAQVGGQQDALRQAQIEADMARYYEEQSAEMDAINRYSAMLMGYGGMGGQQTSQQPGINPVARVAGAGLGGLGIYGAMSMNPATAPFAIPAGLAGGLLGLF